MIEIGKVIASTPGTIQVILKDVEVFENNKPNIRISRYVVIEDGNDLKILAAIQNISAVQSMMQNQLVIHSHVLPLVAIRKMKMVFILGRVELICHLQQNLYTYLRMKLLMLYLAAMIIFPFMLDNFLITKR